ncbi:DUF3618 domain-containing protein [Rhodobacteraceae bacterium CCMM004]|nr:DUF3618 domain-containing protein [Rhodobacteraceae bacterium CCMM004]
MTDHKSSAEIEREIEQERSALTDSIDRLQDQFSPERLVETVTAQFRENGGDMARSIGRAAKDNPIALALTGVGIAWLIAGSGSGSRGRRRWDDDDWDDRDRRPAVAYDPRTRPTAAGFRSEGPAYAGVDDRIAAADAAMRSERYGDDDDDGPSLWGRIKDGAASLGESVRSGAEATRDSVTGAASSAWEGTSGAAASARGGAQGAYRSAADRAARSREQAYMSAAQMRARISEGTDSMSEAARERVIAARMRAYEMQRDIERSAHRGADRVERMHRDEPLVFGAIALALGAAAGAMMPRTEVEDRSIGGYRDQAFDEADRIFREESAKLKKVAQAAAEEGKAIAGETVEGAKEKTPHGQEAVDRAEAKAREAAQRVGDAAKAEADRQNLGGSAT